MHVKTEKYIIASRDAPIEFYCGDGEITDDISEAEIYHSVERAKIDLSKFDESDEYVIMQGQLIFDL